MGEVSDSVHLRRFCRIGISGPVPDESTVGKLTRRLGPEVVHELTRLVIAKARREKRFRPRAARIDATVVEADVALPDRRRVGLRRGEGACAGGSQARADDQGEAHRGPGSFACARQADARDLPHDAPPLGGGEGRGAEADRADRRAALRSR